MTPARAIRILMTTDAVGGVWIYSTSLACALCKDGHEVTLVAMGPAPRADQLRELRDVPRLHLECTDLALEWMDVEGNDAGRARNALLRIADRVRPDIVHLNSYREASFDWTAPTLAVAHSCVQSWWQACREDRPIDLRWRSYTAAVARGLRSACSWAAPTAAFRDVVEAIYRPPTRGHVIWNGTGPQPGCWPKQPIILAAGRLWDEAKGLSALVEVAPRLDWRLRLAGPSSRESPQRAPLAAGVEHLGALPHAAVLEEMQHAGIFVSPAVYEPFGLTVLEAAACGCALALADIPSFRELWDGAALFFEPRDADAMTAALLSLCRDQVLRGRMQRAAAIRARRYSLEAMTTGYLTLYQALLAPVHATMPGRATLAAELRA
jgi:glycosyltransferase involved in cell wall biosynthesis